MKTVNIQYFALLREQAGVDTETFKTSGSTYADLYEELKAKHGFSLPLQMIQVAVNDEFSQLKNEIVEGSRIVFIPPVAGG